MGSRPRSLGSPIAFGITFSAWLACSGSRPPQEVEVAASASVRATCSPMGCINALVVALDDVKLEPGAYELELDGDGLKVRCSFSLPTREELDEACAGELPIAIQPLERASETVGVHSLLLSSAPQQLNGSILRGGALVTKLEARPAYTSFSPNGAGCEPTCRTAEVRIPPR